MSAATLFARNEGTADRALRIALGLVLLAIAATGRGTWGYLGIVPLMTGLIGSCPLYSILGVSTCSIRK